MLVELVETPPKALILVETARRALARAVWAVNLHVGGAVI